ncbi:MAG: ComEC/Rec2 family competence protein [Bacteroidales bacterium]|nr:ComEC/Rec2 family competence protein [Candidatus Liminaster caballi]
MSKHVVYYCLLFVVAIQLVVLVIDARRYPTVGHTEFIHSVLTHSDAMHQRCLDRLHSLQLTPHAEALAAGLILGDKRQLDKSVVRDMRDAGMSHILAVSGLHVGIVWLLIWYSLSMVVMPVVYVSGVDNIAVNRYMRLVTLSLLWLYIFIVGCQPSVLRAGIMISIAQLSVLFRQDVWNWRCLLYAVVLMLVIQPSVFYEVGFQLSVSAMIGIYALLPLIVPRSDGSRRHEGFWLRIGHVVWRLLWMSIAAQVFTTPLVAYYFHHFSVFSCFQALLVVPVVSILIYLLAFALIVPSSVALLSYPIEAITWWIEFVASFVSRFELWFLSARAEWYPSLTEVLFYEFMLALAVTFWRIGYERERAKKNDIRFHAHAGNL